MFKSLFSGAPATTKVQTVTAETAKKLHGDKDILFVDVRGLGEIQSSGTVKGAVRAPLPEFATHACADGSGSLPAQTSNVRIICVCASGARSGAAAAQLVEMGYKDVANLSGGIGGWLRAGGPSER